MNIFSITNWRHTRGQLKHLLGQLTGNDKLKRQGTSDMLVGTIQKRYNHAKHSVSSNLGKFKFK